MNNNVSEKTKQTIRNLFKELIKVYRTKKYKDEIISAESKKSYVPTFHLRFFPRDPLDKRGKESIYYRVLLNPEDNKS